MKTGAVEPTVRPNIDNIAAERYGIGNGSRALTTRNIEAVKHSALQRTCGISRGSAAVFRRPSHSWREKKRHQEAGKRVKTEKSGQAGN